MVPGKATMIICQIIIQPFNSAAVVLIKYDLFYKKLSFSNSGFLNKSIVYKKKHQLITF